MSSRPFVSNNNNFKTNFYKNVMPKIYGIGASVVIAGAMFKLLNWPGGALMLGVGLTTEAIIFFLSAFGPQDKELDWTKAYPELLEGYEGGASKARSNTGGPVGEKLDEMFAQAKIDNALVERLGQDMHRLSDSVAHITESMVKLQAASSETEKVKTELGQLSEKLASLNNIYGNMLTALKN